MDETVKFLRDIRNQQPAEPPCRSASDLLARFNRREPAPLNIYEMQSPQYLPEPEIAASPLYEMQSPQDLLARFNRPERTCPRPEYLRDAEPARPSRTRNCNFPLYSYEMQSPQDLPVEPEIAAAEPAGNQFAMEPDVGKLSNRQQKKKRKMAMTLSALADEGCNTCNNCSCAVAKKKFKVEVEAEKARRIIHHYTDHLKRTSMVSVMGYFE